MSERIAAYESWIARLEGTLAGYHRRRAIYQRSFAALLVAGYGCFAFGFHVGVWGAISSTLISVAGWAMYKTRLWELEGEIAQTRAEVERMRTGHAE
jgi:uncharacterized small protein (DUF1192 family)